LNPRPLGYEPNDDRLGRLRRLRALYLPAPTRGDRCRCLGSSHASRRVLLAFRLANAGADLPFSAALSYLQIRRSGHIAQGCPMRSVRWAVIPQLSVPGGCCPPSWQQYWQQSRRGCTDPRPSAFLGGDIPKLLRIIRVTCAAAGRCCLPMAAAVAVTVAVRLRARDFCRCPSGPGARLLWVTALAWYQ
jgi:hypothetical protein